MIIARLPLTLVLTAALMNRALDPARFFANPATQALAPGAFAVQAESVPVLESLERLVPAQRAALVEAIRADPDLAAGVARFPDLTWPERRALIEKLVPLEARVFGANPPVLNIHGPDEAGPGPAFFEFDPDAPGTGTVHLWPSALAEEPSPHAALMLAIHETRHSWQFQVAFGTAPGAPCDPAIAAAFAAGFRAQKALGRKLSFCDFCTLHHEHEAFQMGNHVVGALTGWSADTTGMGCWSSQYDAHGAPLIDLIALARQHGAAGMTAAFNEAERGQFVQMGGSSRR